MKRILVWLFVFFVLTDAYSSYAQKQVIPALREGAHNFTLQWISWDQPGKVQIHKKADGTYIVKGEQRDAQSKSFVTIDGTLKIVSPAELEFTGTIKSCMRISMKVMCVTGQVPIISWQKGRGSTGDCRKWRIVKGIMLWTI
jgi:hypothetical protein